MKLNITRPLVIFDLETTGLDISKDRIIQMSYIKVLPNGTEIRKNIFVNPERKLPAIITEITSITDEMLESEPTFKEIAEDLAREFADCDFAGFNSNRFDIPMLAEEMLRAGVYYDFSKSRLIDVQTIFHKMEKRNLAAAYKFYCGRKMEDDFQAHLADHDTEATYRVLQSQLDMYAPGVQEDEERQLPNDIDAIAEFSRQNNNVDFAGRIIWGEVKGANGEVIMNEDGKPRRQEVFNFGKYKGIPVADVLRRDPGYYSWMQAGDFPLETKQWMTRIKLRETYTKKF